LTINLDVPYGSVNGTVLTAKNIADFNFLGHMNDVVPRPLTFADVRTDSDSFEWNVPGISVTVLQFDL
jgi:alpha-L-arabinofuranosidase